MPPQPQASETQMSPCDVKALQECLQRTKGDMQKVPASLHREGTEGPCKEDHMWIKCHCCQSMCMSLPSQCRKEIDAFKSACSAAK